MACAAAAGSTGSASLSQEQSKITLESLPHDPGPALHFTVAAGEGPVVLGRSQNCGLKIPDPAASRRHAELSCEGQSWRLRDLGSSHGTFVNEARLPTQAPAALRHGDLVRIGAVTLRVHMPQSAGATIISTFDTPARTLRVGAVPGSELRGLAQRQLNALLQAAAELRGAGGPMELGEILARAAQAGVGSARCALLRPIAGGEEVELLGGELTSAGGAGPVISRSLVRLAARGQLAKLSEDGTVGGVAGQSLIDLNIRSAICAPIKLADQVEALLYLDSRNQERPLSDDAAAFALALAELAGLALANIERAVVARELEIARQVQVRIIPPESGEHAGIVYSRVWKPGRTVAGDLFNIIETADGRIAVLFGDVTGKGAGAALTMAVVQTYVQMAFGSAGDSARIMNELNDFLQDRLPPGHFITLWLGVIDCGNDCIRFIDAGHGYCWHISACGEVKPVDGRRGLPVGAVHGERYLEDTLRFVPGDRLVLCSDGLVEQNSPTAEAFGQNRVAEILRSCGDAAEDVEKLNAALQQHAGGRPLKDDMTIASLGRVGA